MLFTGSRKTGDLKFVDFQISRIGSPIQDLPHFLCTSTQPNVLNEHFDEMLNLYYENFSELLTKLNCETSLFTKESFEKELKRIASRNLIHTLSALQFIILEVTENMDTNDMKTLLVSSGVSNSYLERSWNIVSKYVEKKWIWKYVPFKSSKLGNVDSKSYKITKRNTVWRINDISTSLNTTKNYNLTMYFSIAMTEL